MAHDDMKLPGTWVFRGVSLMLNMAIVIAILWVRAEIKKELGEYVTTKEFSTYKDDHEKWGDQVVKRLQASVDNVQHHLDRIESKVDRIIEKRPEK